jgi:lipopolysaccharide export system permease protein
MKLTKLIASPTVFWYLTRRLAGPVMVALAVFTLVDVLGEGADRFAGWFRSGVAIDGFGYLALRVPFMVSQLMPVAILGGVMFAFAMLHRAEEVIAIQAVGISRAQMALPVFTLGIALTLGNFVLSEGLVPITNARAELMLASSLRHDPAEERDSRRVWLRTRGGFLMAESYDRRHAELHEVTIFRLGEYPQLDAITQVERAWWDGHAWVLNGIQELAFKPDGSITPVRPDGVLGASPTDFNAVIAFKPEELSLRELNQFIDALGRYSAVPAELCVLRALKFALPVSCLVMAMLGLAGSLEPTPRRSGLGKKIGLAVGAGVGYWLLLGFTVSLGKAGVLGAWPAAWIPDLLWAALALSLFLLGEEKAATQAGRDPVA